MAVPIRGPIPKPAAPTPVPGLTKGLMRVARSVGEDSPTSVPNVQRYPGVVGPFAGARSVPPVPVPQGAEPGLADSRLRLIQFLKASKKRGPEQAQQLRALQGGGKPQGPLYQGWQSELVRSLLQGV